MVPLHTPLLNPPLWAVVGWISLPLVESATSLAKEPTVLLSASWAVITVAKPSPAVPLPGASTTKWCRMPAVTVMVPMESVIVVVMGWVAMTVPVPTVMALNVVDMPTAGVTEPMSPVTVQVTVWLPWNVSV